MSTEQLNTGTYEIIQNRLNEQRENLIQRIQALNEDRKKVFGGVDFSLIANERISTDQNCQIKDIFSLGNLCLVGHNTHLGLRTEINLNDVFSAYLLIDNRFEPQPIQFIEDETFIEEFKNNTTTIVIGSSWPKDEELLVNFINNSTENVKFIIAPHNIKSEQILEHRSCSFFRGKAGGTLWLSYSRIQLDYSHIFEYFG